MLQQPEILVEEFIQELKKKFIIEIEEVEIIKEDITFKIPGKVKLIPVYKKLIQKILAILKINYNIGKIKSFTGIKKGIENTNYLLKTKIKNLY